MHMHNDNLNIFFFLKRTTTYVKLSSYSCLSWLTAGGSGGLKLARILSVSRRTWKYREQSTIKYGSSQQHNQSPHSDYVTRCYFNLASSKDHVTIEYHVMCLVFCMYSTLYSVQYGEILLSKFHILSYFFFKYDKLIFLIMII